MSEKRRLPAALREKLSKAGKARAAQITPEERSRWAKAAWEKRVQKAEAEENAQQQPPNHIGGTAVVTPPGDVTIPEAERTWPPQE